MINSAKTEMAVAWGPLELRKDHCLGTGVIRAVAIHLTHMNPNPEHNLSPEAWNSFGAHDAISL